jgi:DNA-binding ferritin-like protein
MSQSQRAVIKDPTVAAQRTLLVLERELMDTLALQSQLRQARFRLDDTRFLSLVDSLDRELVTFVERIRNRLDSWGQRKPAPDPNAPFWNWFKNDSDQPSEQFRYLVSAYVRYEKRTLEAIENLEWYGDVESWNLLRSILGYIERCLCFLEVYLEGLALNTDSRLMPQWTATA